MLLKLVLAGGLLASVVFAAQVPPDLTVYSFTAEAMDKAIQKALDSKPLSRPKTSTQPFPTQELMRALEAAARVQSQCAIPLREVRGGNGQIMDPLAKPAGNATFDPMAKPSPIGPCYFNVSSVK